MWCRPMVGAAGVLAVQLDVAGIAPEQIVGGLLGPAGFVPVQYGTEVAPGEIWVTAAGIDAVRVHGPGRIMSASCIDLDCARRRTFDRIAMVGPPFDDLASYRAAPITDPAPAAEQRVRNGAPKLVSLVDAMSPSSLSAGPNDPDREWDRVRHLVRPDLEERYREMLDSTDSPLLHRPTSDLRGPRAAADPVATLSVPSYAVLMAASREPSVARWAGLSYVDTDPIVQEHSIYRIRASFDPDRVFADSDETPEVLAALDVHAVEHDLDIDDPRKVLEAYVAVVPGARPPLPVPMDVVSDHVRWVASAPTRRRIVEAEFDPPVGAVAYAWYRWTGGPFMALNPERHKTRYRLLSPGTRRRSGSARWVLADPDVGPGPVDHGISATDAFGRWSSWTTVSTPAGPAVAPPPPVVEAHYLGAPVTPVDDAPRAGEVRVTIPVPDELPPGCAPIDGVNVRVETSGGTLVSSTTVPVSADDEITVTLAGPLIERSAWAALTAAAQFQAGGRLSTDGTAPVTAADGRPPAPVTIAPDVHWTTRSDAVDSSRIVLEWGAGAGHLGYRLYVATSRTLVDHLSGLGTAGTEALGAVSSPTAPMADIAVALSTHSGALPRSAFELVTSKMVEPEAGTGRYELVLPGRSRLLYLVRVVAVGPNNVDEDWAGPPALFYVAVPPTVRLQPPELTVTPRSTPVNAVRVTATLRGSQQAVAWRLFRTTKPDLAVLGKMSEVIHQPVTTAEPTDPVASGGLRPPLATLDYEDLGPSRHGPGATLRAWRTYIYRAQVQGGSEPGAPPGVWSDLSLAVSATVVPDEPPPAAVVTATRTTTGLDIAWSCDLPARRTRLGDFRFRVLLREDGTSIADEVHTQSALGPFTRSHPQDPGSAPFPRTEVLVETIDPVGRRRLSEPVIVEAGP